MRAFMILAIALVATSARTQECSLPEGYRAIDDLPIDVESRNPIPMPPALRLESLRRGFDDGVSGTCSVVGELTLVVEDAVPSISVAYYFEIMSGNLPAATFPEQLIVPVELAGGELGFVFRWLDLAPGAEALDPIDVTIGARRISAFGMVSAPTTLRIAHSGGPLPPKAYAGTITFFRQLTLLAIALLLPLFLYAYLRQRRAWRQKLSEYQEELKSKSDSDAPPRQ